MAVPEPLDLRENSLKFLSYIRQLYNMLQGGIMLMPLDLLFLFSKRHKFLLKNETLHVECILKSCLCFAKTLPKSTYKSFIFFFSVQIEKTLFSKLLLINKLLVSLQFISKISIVNKIYSYPYCIWFCTEVIIQLDEEYQN
jgi:hypothetical protein